MLYEKIVQVQSSPQASGSSYLKMLDVEEEPHLLTVLMEKMASAEEEQLQKLAGQMAARMSDLKQGKNPYQQHCAVCCIYIVHATVCVCVCVCTRAHMRACIHAWVCACLHTCMGGCVRACMRVMLSCVWMCFVQSPF